jgi:hypothetical protein
MGNTGARLSPVRLERRAPEVPGPAFRGTFNQVSDARNVAPVPLRDQQEAVRGN